MQQSGTIEDLFERPSSLFVASFVGMNNIFPCQVNYGVARVSGITLHVQPDAEPGHTHLAVRPEEIRLANGAGKKFANHFHGRITQLDCQGFYYLAKILVQDVMFQAYWTRHEVEEREVHTGQELYITFPPSVVHTFAEPQLE
jgi:ABC-type Fe3+/spermidine/putrescine transport system ATPase subunit